MTTQPTKRILLSFDTERVPTTILKDMNQFAGKILAYLKFKDAADLPFGVSLVEPQGAMAAAREIDAALLAAHRQRLKDFIEDKSESDTLTPDERIAIIARHTAGSGEPRRGPMENMVRNILGVPEAQRDKPTQLQGADLDWFVVSEAVNDAYCNGDGRVGPSVLQAAFFKHGLVIFHADDMKSEFDGVAKKAREDALTLRPSQSALVEALQQWKCPACGGKGTYQQDAAGRARAEESGKPHDPKYQPDAVECKKCEGHGVHPIAYAAINQAKADGEGK